MGNSKSRDKFVSALEAGRHVLLYGPPGVGKTSAVYWAAEALGYEVYEVNASDRRTSADLDELRRKVRYRGLRKWLLLLDEADGISDWRGVRRILSESVVPVVLTANEKRAIPKSVEMMCVTVRFDRPRVEEIAAKVREIAKKEGVTPNFKGLSRDVRSSINAALYGGTSYDTRKVEELVEDIFRRGWGGEKLNDALYIWLLDNIPNFYWGKNLFKAIRILALASRTRPDVLSCLPSGRGRAKFPYYFKRASAFKEGRKNG